MPEQQLALQALSPGRTFRAVRGWYRFRVLTQSSVAVFTLQDHQQPAFVEITATWQKPGHAKIAAGDYVLTLRKSDDNATVSIERMDHFELVVFFARETLKRIKLGTSPLALLRHARRALKASEDYGQVAELPVSQALSHHAPPGKLSRAYFDRLNLPQDIALAIHPRIYIDITSPGESAMRSLALQTYVHFTVDPVLRSTCQYVLALPGDAWLGVNALAIMAATGLQTDAKVVYADVFIGETPTFSFAFDKRLHTHADMLSDLVMVARPLDDNDGDLTGLTWQDISRISLPLAQYNHPFNSLNTGKRQIACNCARSDARVSCIIPTRDRAGLLANIARGLLDESESVEDIIVVDNGSIEPETHTLFERLRSRGVKIVRDDGDFNFSRLCNLGAAHAESPILAFINNDIEVARSDWLSQMARQALQPDVGAVGTRLLYKDGSLQHGGVALGMFGHSGHLFRRWPRESWQTIPSLIYASSRSAVTGAVLVIEASKFHRVGGFDSLHFPVTLNDVDLCLRLNEAGFGCVYEPAGEAYHLEGVSRGDDMSSEKQARRNAELRHFIRKWNKAIEAELWFSPALSRTHENIRIL
ncbi:hypothetical protein MMA231_03450 (plasmid) [Asticcacaulis sp. MM231]|uniref:glycosyltransferase family 2 protein n=1 Tax=Asticcacaulis sp. MM231 TaxID=3157666 RepID=UPI0032D5A1A8